ncbi:hypothetical protein JW707_01590 [Candidatus Woesearchaeota archaeon]|nr:hypothetical protein [Candidatus Woesearchaeota archaeon]
MNIDYTISPSGDDGRDDMPAPLSEAEIGQIRDSVVAEVKRMSGIPPAKKGELYADMLAAELNDPDYIRD